MSKYKETLENMVWEFAYRDTKDGKSILWAGCNRTLEEAFEVLGWSDPKIIDDIDGCICDVEGCPGWVEAQGGMWTESGYWCLCGKHCDEFRKGKPQPKMKQRAIDREASRNTVTRCLPLGKEQ